MGVLGPIAPAEAVACLNNLLLVSVLRKFNTLEELWLGGDSLI